MFGDGRSFAGPRGKLSTIVTIRSLKYDGAVRRTWKADLIEQTPFLYTFLGTFDKAVDHPDLGRIEKGTASYEYIWPDRWYNVFRFHEPDGSLRNWYCNVGMPPSLEDDVLSYVDLDIDILIWPTGAPIVLDEDEFAIHAARYEYPVEVLHEVENAKQKLLEMIAGREFPFDIPFN